MATDDLPTKFVDPDRLRADIRREVQKQSRIYLIVVALVSMVVGGLIVKFTARETTSPGNPLTPPPYWGEVCLPETRLTGATPVPTATPQLLRVYISGAVKHPGVVTVPEGSLLTDAVDAAGGATADADLENVNLAAPLSDNQHVSVPRRATTLRPTTATASQPKTVTVPTTAPAPAPININTATAAELQTLPHISPAMAERIIAYREANGPFQSIEDLQKVEGIGETRFKDIAPLITVK